MALALLNFYPSYQVCNTFIYSTLDSHRSCADAAVQKTQLRLYTGLSLSGQSAESQYVGGVLSHKWDIYITVPSPRPREHPRREENCKSWRVGNARANSVSGHGRTAALVNLTTTVVVCTRPW